MLPLFLLMPPSNQNFSGRGEKEIERVLAKRGERDKEAERRE
jgi:hypothetical protein